MCSVLFTKKLDVCPYSTLFNDHMFIDIQHQFSRDFCSSLGLSPDSPLFTAVTVGTTALPIINKMTSILKKGVEWSQEGELPVEVPLLDSHRFHSIFVCPVSKETATQENPAMLMACGHVMVQESLARLSKGNPMARFKCPYCPTESTASQAMEIHF